MAEQTIFEIDLNLKGTIKMGVTNPGGGATPCCTQAVLRVTQWPLDGFDGVAEVLCNDTGLTFNPALQWGDIGQVRLNYAGAYTGVALLSGVAGDSEDTYITVAKVLENGGTFEYYTRVNGIQTDYETYGPLVGYLLVRICPVSLPA